jgi:transposase-like protein
MASANGRGLGSEPARRATRSRREYWRALIEECRRSGVSQAEFCRRRDIPSGTLGYWKCILAREGPRSRSSVRSGPEPPAFLPMRITVPPPRPEGVETDAASDEGSELEIVLGHGRRIRVRGRVDVQWLGQVVAALDAPRC